MSTITTINGWNLVTLPTFPAYSTAQTIEWTMNDIVATSTSPFTAQTQTQDWQQGWLEASVSIQPMKQPDAQAWVAFLMSCRGQANVFVYGDPTATSPQGTGQGTGRPVVAAAGQVGYSLMTSGWTPSTLGVLLPGDWIQVGVRLYRTLNTVNPDGSGNATISIWPPIRETPNAGDPLTLTRPQGLFRLASNQRKYSVTFGHIYGIQFNIREAL